LYRVKKKFMSRIKELYKIIEEAKKEIEEIRTNCQHIKTFKGDYMWAPGHINTGYICEDCGKYLGKDEN